MRYTNQRILYFTKSQTHCGCVIVSQYSVDTAMAGEVQGFERPAVGHPTYEIDLNMRNSGAGTPTLKQYKCVCQQL